MLEISIGWTGAGQVDRRQLPFYADLRVFAITVASDEFDFGQQGRKDSAKPGAESLRANSERDADDADEDCIFHGRCAFFVEAKLPQLVINDGQHCHFPSPSPPKNSAPGGE
jgi:hypothetical protein